MKCPKCSKTLKDGSDFCIFCGTSTKSTPAINVMIQNLLSKKYLVIIVGVVVVLGVVFFIISENNNRQKIKDDIESYYWQKEWSEYANKPSSYDLTIQSGWTKRVSGNYMYIEGTVKNTSDKTISYYEINAKFYDSKGNVIDTDYTNSGKDLAPGESRKFEIMHKNDYNITDVKLSVGDVS